MSRTHWLTLFVAAAVLAGCSKHEDPDRDALAASPESEKSGDSKDGDPCTLLELSEVESAIGALVGPPYREGVDGPDATGGKCVYQTKDLHRIVLDVTWTDGAMIMKMLGMPAAVADQAALFGENAKDTVAAATTVAKYPGPWENADVIALDFVAVRGDVIMHIDIRGTSLDNAQALMAIAMNRVAWPPKP